MHPLRKELPPPRKQGCNRALQPSSLDWDLREAFVRQPSFVEVGGCADRRRGLTGRITERQGGGSPRIGIDY